MTGDYRHKLSFTASSIHFFQFHLALIISNIPIHVFSGNLIVDNVTRINIKLHDI